MTVANQPTYISYIADGGTTGFPYPYKYNSPLDFEVHLIDTSSDTLLTSGYSVVDQSSGTSNGCRIDFSSAPASGVTVFIDRQLDIEQGTDLPTGGAFLERVIEGALDYITMLLQQQQGLHNRTVKTPLGMGPSLTLDLPMPDDYKAIGWYNNELVNLSGISGITVTSYMESFLAGVTDIYSFRQTSGVSTAAESVAQSIGSPTAYEIQGLNKEIVCAAGVTLSVNQVAGTVLNNYGQTAGVTITLPVATSGLQFVFLAGTSLQDILAISPAVTNFIYLAGASTGLGKAVYVNPVQAGQAISFISFQTGEAQYDWVASAVRGSWALVG